MTTSEQHKKRMRERRERQLARQPGFTPVPNKRINAAIQTQTILVMAEAHERKLNLSQVEIHQRAVNRVAASLPRPRMVRSYRPRPSKNDSAAYRKQAA